MADEPETLQQKLLKKLFVLVHASHETDLPYNKCLACNQLVQDTILEACEPPKSEGCGYEGMGCSAYDAFLDDLESR